MADNLTYDQIYALAVKHGFAPGSEAAHATAIAMAESQGYPSAFNPKDTAGGSVGLMQINGANAGLIGGDSWKTTGKDPDASMAAAHALYARRGNFTDWGAYTDGRYKQYLDPAFKTASTSTAVPGPLAAAGHGSVNQLGQPTGEAPTTAAPTAVADDRPWWQKAASDFVMPGTDPKTGLQTDSPMAKMVERYNKAPEEMRAKEADQAPSQEMANQLARSPGARNVGPMGGVQLSSVPQTYGQTINSLGAPLTWNNLPPQAPQGPRAGYQAAVPGMSLNSFQGPPMASLDPYGLGYGSIGYGFG